MDLNEIITEMQRKPDEQFLLEWIHDHARDLPSAREAIDAYFAALEER